MNMPYNGTLKTWLYAPILLHASHPNAALIRLPVIITGAATIVMFWGFLRRVHSRRAAWIGCILLATDTCFLLTTTYDWGPVALQHLLLVTVVFFAIHWFQTNAIASLAASGFCCGLALWDKAEFVWVFAGLIAGLLLFTPTIRLRLTPRHTAMALAGLFLGALPLIVYNITGNPKFGTLRANPQLGADLTAADFARKLQTLRTTLDGSTLFLYLVNEDWAPQPKSARTKIQRASFAIHRLTGKHRRNNMPLALYTALVLFPLLWRTRARRVMSFSLVAVVIAWLFMACTGGGGAAHHAILLWPLLHLFIAIAFTEASLHVRFGKWILVSAVAFLAVTNVMVTNQYLYQFIRNGASDAWSDGIYALAEHLKQSNASQIIMPDWGMTDSLCVLTHNSPGARVADDSFLSDTKSAAQREDDLQTLSDPRAIWLEHVPGHETFSGVNDRLVTTASRAGFEPVMLQTYLDSNGRAIFQTLRFALQKYR
jgi:hypothetical protein